VIIGRNGERDPAVAEEVILLFSNLYDILSSDELNFGLSKYRSFKEKAAFAEKMRSAANALDPLSTGYARITYAQAFVKCAQVANNMLISDMKDQ
jgi:hypothetical protein